MPFDSVALHNVAECRETTDGYRLQRVPEAVRRELNEGAAERMCIPSSSELRFVPAGGSLGVTLSSPAGATEVVPFWGGFQQSEPVSIGPKPTVVEVTPPEELLHIDAAKLPDQPFAPSVCRLCLQYTSPGPVYVHAVDGDGVRPPRPSELPSTRLLAYGTSIAEGFRATRSHLTYPAVAARALGIDHCNLGTSGSAYCEPAMADHIAGRDDWDVATVELSSNMMNAGFSLDEFEARAEYMLRTLADARPDAPIVAISILRRRWDVDPAATDDAWAGTPADFRAAYRDVVERIDRDTVTYVDGRDLLRDLGGTSTDLVHPGDAGMHEIGTRLADRIRERTDLVSGTGNGRQAR